MANKKVVIEVDIQAQAEQLNKIINQSKQSLKTLSSNIDTSQYKSLEQAFEKISKNANNLTTNLKTGLSNPSSFANAQKGINRLYEDYASVIRKIQNMGIDPQKIIPDVAKGTKQNLDKAVKDLKNMGSKAGKEFGEGLRTAVQQAIGKGDIQGIKNLEKQALQALDPTKFRNNAARLGKIIKNVDIYKNVTPEGVADVAQQRLNTASQYSGQKLRDYEKKIGRTTSQLQGDIAASKNYKDYTTKKGQIQNASINYQQQATEVQKLTARIQQLETELQKLAGPARQQAQQGMNQLTGSTQKVKQSTEEMTGALNNSSKAFETQSKRAGQLNQLKSYFGYMFSATSIIMKMSQAIRGALNDFKELDKQFNEISIVTGKTMDELWLKYDNLNFVAREYGVTINDVVSTQKLYYQQGRSAAEVTQLTGETLTLAKISGLDFAKATEYMTAAINAYNIAASDANVITDTYSALSAKAAVDANEVAVAMSKVASLASMSGAEFSETSAYLTKIIETTREAPETAGTALKTVIARFTAVNKLTEDQAELLDDDYNFNNIEKALKFVGIAAKDTNGQIRGFTEILGELGPIWDTLDANTQHYIATQAAGARQQSRFIALMNDWGRTQDLISVAETSAGTGAKQLALAMDSIATAQNRLTSAWQDFYTQFLQSDMFKGLLNTASELLEILTDIAEVGSEMGPGGTIALFAGIAAGITLAVKSAIGWGKDFAYNFQIGRMAVDDPAEAARMAKEHTYSTRRGKVAGESYANTYNATVNASKAANEAAHMAAEPGIQGSRGAVGGSAYSRSFQTSANFGAMFGELGGWLRDGMPIGKGMGAQYFKTTGSLFKGKFSGVKNTINKFKRRNYKVHDGWVDLPNGGGRMYMGTQAAANMSKSNGILKSITGLGKTFKNGLGKATKTFTKGFGKVTKTFTNGFKNFGSTLNKGFGKVFPKTQAKIIGKQRLKNSIPLSVNGVNSGGVMLNPMLYGMGMGATRQGMFGKMKNWGKTKFQGFRTWGESKGLFKPKQLSPTYIPEAYQLTDGQNGASVVKMGGKAALMKLAIPIIAIVGTWMLASGIMAKQERERVKKEQETLGKTEESQKKIDDALEKTRTLSDNYNRALELQQLGLLRTTEETEEYQQVLNDLKQTYPEMVKTFSDGTLEMVATADSIFQDEIKKLRNDIREEYSNIGEITKETKVALSAGIVFSDEGKNLQEGIKTTAANLTEMTDDAIEGIIGKDIEAEDLTMISERGLTRETLNEAVNKEQSWWNAMFLSDEWDLSQSDYLDMLEHIAAGEVGQDDIWGGKGRIAQEVALIKYFADQAGMTIEELAQQLIKEADGTSMAVERNLDLIRTYASEMGMNVSDYVKDYIKDQEDKIGADKAEIIGEQYYKFNSKEVISGFEKFIDNLDSLSGTALDNAKYKNFGILGTQAKDMAKSILAEQIKQQEEDRTAFIETLNYVSNSTDYSDDNLEKYTTQQLKQMTQLASNLSRNYGNDQVKPFIEQYKDYIDTIEDNSYLFSQFSQVDMLNMESIAEYAAQLSVYLGNTADEYTKFVDLVNKSNSVLDRSFKNLSEMAKGLKDDISGLRDGLELIQNLIDGTLEAEEALGLVEKYRHVFSLENFTTSPTGLKLIDENNIERAIDLQRKLIEIEYKKYAMEIQAGQEYYYSHAYGALGGDNPDKLSRNEVDEYIRLLDAQSRFKILSDTDETRLEELKSKVEKLTVAEQGAIQEALEFLPYVEKSAENILVIFEQIFIDMQREGILKPIKTLLELLEKLEEYSDVDAFIQSEQLKLDHYEFELEFTTNIDNVVETTKSKINSMGNIINANLAKSDRATKNAAIYKNSLETDFEGFVDFDDDDNLLINDQKVTEWMQTIAKLPEADQEIEMDRLNNLFERIDLYRQEKNLIQESKNEAERQTQQMEEFINSLKEEVVEVEDKFLNLFIERDEKALESLKERYDAMKEADQDYLQSVREAIEEERKLRDRSQEADDIAKMERQLELLRMSGGSAVEIQGLEEKIKESRQKFNDSEQDALLDQMEKEANKRAEDYDEEVLYQEAVLEAKKENQILYNQEIALLMKQDKETILNTWKGLDSEFLSSTENNKELLIGSMDAMVTKAKANSQILADPDGYIPKVEKAYTEVKNEIDIDTKAMETFGDKVAKESGEAVLKLQTIKDEYFNIASNIQLAIEKQNELNEAMGLEINTDFKKFTKGVGPDDKDYESGNANINATPQKTFEIQDTKTLANGITWYKVSEGGKDVWYNGTSVTKSEDGKSFSVSTVSSGISEEDLNKKQVIALGDNQILQKAYANIFEWFSGDHSRYTGKTVNKKTGEEVTRDFTLRDPDKGSTKLTLSDTRDLNSDGETKKAKDIANDKWHIFEATESHVGLKHEGGATQFISTEMFLKYFAPRFAKGGIVDFTGPAWVDGTPSKPEAFLSANDTSLIAGLRDVLRSNPRLTQLNSTPIQKSGDTYYEIHINVDELGDGYSVDDLMSELEDRITQVTDKNAVIKLQ